MICFKCWVLAETRAVRSCFVLHALPLVPALHALIVRSHQCLNAYAAIEHVRCGACKTRVCAACQKNWGPRRAYGKACQ